MIVRQKMKLQDVDMEILGQVRRIEEINVVLEHNTVTDKYSRIISLEEYRRIEQIEHFKIMKERRKRK